MSEVSQLLPEDPLRRFPDFDIYTDDIGNSVSFILPTVQQPIQTVPNVPNFKFSKPTEDLTL